MNSSFEWQTVSPESEGMNSAVLEDMSKQLAERGTRTLVVIRNDKIVYEWYADGFGPRVKHFSASLAKALVAGLSLSIALDDGLIDIDDLAWKYIPAWKDHPQKSKITIKHLATHTSGIENSTMTNLNESDTEDRNSWQAAFWPDWKGNLRPADPFRVARDEAPVLFEPGTAFEYSNPGTAMLAYAVTAALKNTPHRDIRTLLRARVMRPIGVPDDEWSIGYENVLGHDGAYEVDGLRLVDNWGGAAYSARAAARVGRLMLRRGEWEGRRIIGKRWIETAIRHARLPGSRKQYPVTSASGLMWWTNAKGDWGGGLPLDAFAGSGHQNQILLVIPSLDLILVRNGRHIEDRNYHALATYLFQPLMATVTESSLAK